MFAVLFESEQEKKRREMLARVTKTVDGHRLRKMRDLLALEKLATCRRMNGFDQVVEDEKNWFHVHRSLSLIPEQYTASLRHELQKLKDEELQKQKMAEFRSDSLDGLLANFEFARIKE